MAASVRLFVRAWVVGVLSMLALAVQAAPAATGPLHTSGTRIVDGQGGTVQLHSVQVLGLGSGAGNSTPDACGLEWSPPPAQDVSDIASQGFNAVRLAIAWANLEPTAPTVQADGSLAHRWNAPYLAALDGVVQAFASRGVGVILEMHQSQWSPAFKSFTASGKTVCEGSGLPVWLYPDAVPGQTPSAAKCEFFLDQARSGVPERPQEGLAAAWRMLAERYDDPDWGVIGIDVLNEPGWPASCAATQSDLAAFYGRVANAVQPVNPDLLFIYEDVPYASYLKKGFTLSEAVPTISNAVLSFHYYPPDWAATTTGTPPTTGQQQLAAFWQQAQAFGVPLFIGEFNAFNQGYNNPSKHTDQNWASDTAAMLDYCRTNAISWSFWAYQSGAGSSLLRSTSGTVKKPLLRVLQGGF